MLNIHGNGGIPELPLPGLRPVRRNIGPFPRVRIVFPDRPIRHPPGTAIIAIREIDHSVSSEYRMRGTIGRWRSRNRPPAGATIIAAEEIITPHQRDRYIHRGKPAAG